MRLFRRKAVATPGIDLSDGELRALLIEDADRGWRTFVDQYTPRILALIERAGIRDQDEAMEVYVLICERLAADDCGRIRRFDPSKGSIGAWLSVLVRNTLVDWVRSRAGRRRLFKSIQALEPLDRKVFELFYWENKMPAEIVGALEGHFGSPTLGAVLEALERVHGALTERQRTELLAMTARASTPASLDAPTDDDEQVIDVADARADVEAGAQVRELDRVMDRALAALPPQEALVIRLRYVEGLSLKQIRTAVEDESLTEQRVRDILARLKQRLAAAGVGSSDLGARGLAFLDGGAS